MLCLPMASRGCPRGPDHRTALARSSDDVHDIVTRSGLRDGFHDAEHGVYDLARRILDGKRELVFGKGRVPHIPKMPAMPAGYTFLNRMQWGFYSVLTRLDARINWYRLLPERMRA